VLVPIEDEAWWALGCSGHFGEDKVTFLCRELNLGLSGLYPVHCTHFPSAGGRVILQQIIKLWGEKVWTELVCTAYGVFTVWCALHTECLLFVVSLKKMGLVFLHVLYMHPHCHIVMTVHFYVCYRKGS